MAGADNERISLADPIATIVEDKRPISWIELEIAAILLEFDLEMQGKRKGEDADDDTNRPSADHGYEIQKIALMDGITAQPSIRPGTGLGFSPSVTS